MLDVSARVFGLVGAAPGLELFPAYSLGAFLQFGADVASAVRVVRDGTLAQALRDGGVTAFEGFDTQRIGFIGNSLGAVVGASVLVAEPDVRFAVQNVPPGSIVETLAESPEFRPLVDAIFLPIFGVEGALRRSRAAPALRPDRRPVALDPRADRPAGARPVPAARSGPAGRRGGDPVPGRRARRSRRAARHAVDARRDGLDARDALRPGRPRHARGAQSERRATNRRPRRRSSCGRSSCRS